MTHYIIDIVGTCNLKCPSCGRREKFTDLRAAPAFKGLMDYDLFLKVLDKIERTSPNQKHSIPLYVWGEPLMHNRIGDMIEAINARGWEATLSTNGNAPKHLEAAIRARPAGMSISLSGFDKKTYNTTHYKGDVDTVISTIFRAWTLIKRYSPETDFLIHYHLYRDNGGENLATLQRIVSALRCDYLFSAAWILAVDDVLDALDGKGNLSDEKTNLLGKFIFSAKEWERMAWEVDSGHNTCPQIDGEWLVINADGSVALCCATFGEDYKLFPSFLDVSDDEIFAARRKHSTCTKCMTAGIPYYNAIAAHSPTFHKRVNEVLRENGGYQYARSYNLGVKNHLAVRGSTARHVATAIGRRLAKMR